MRGAKCTSPTRHSRAGAGNEDLQRADRCQHNRQSQPAAEHLDGRVDLGDIAQHARAKCDLVEPHAVAAHGGLGLSGPDNIIPGILVEIRPCPADELVKILGHQARIWSAGDRTFVLVADESAPEMERMTALVRNTLR